MQFSYTSTDQLQAILATVQERLANNPLSREFMQLIKLWHENQDARRLLAYQYNLRTNQATFSADVIYYLNSHATSIFWHIGRGILNGNIGEVYLQLSYNTIMNTTCTTLTIPVGNNTQIALDILKIINNFGSSITVTCPEDFSATLRLEFNSTNVSTIMNILNSIFSSFEERQIKKVNRNWY